MCFVVAAPLTPAYLAALPSRSGASLQVLNAFLNGKFYFCNCAISLSTTFC